MFEIQETTMGFSPDHWQFDTLEEAKNAIKSLALELVEAKNVYESISELAFAKEGHLNLDEKAYRYSEHWIIESNESPDYCSVVEELYLNRLHHKNGANFVSITKSPKYWNYRNF